MKSHRWSKPSLSSGMALIAVLWVVAALSVLVTGMSRTSRGEVRTVAAEKQMQQARAIGDAAINLALQELAGQQVRTTRALVADIVYQGVSVKVAVAPLNGWIDLNTAPQPLLARLYEIAGGVTPDAAQRLAQLTVEVREQRDGQGQAQRFEASEELLRVPGVEYDLYARLSPLVTVYSGASGRVNPLAAPAGVLAVLSGGNEAVALRGNQDRGAGGDQVDTTALDPAFVAISPSRRYRLEAAVPLVEGGTLQVVRVVDVGSSTRDGLPWRTLQSSNSQTFLPRVSQ